MISAKKRVLLSFTVFAMFFGAGNLIFPPYLGYLAGGNTASAFLGFIITAIGLPVLSLIAIEKAGSLEALSSRVHPVFAHAFTVAIYLAIGPCLAIPRTASTSFEMVANAIPSLQGLSIPYSALFFTLSAIIALKPEKLTKRLGRILSPLLVLLIIILFAASLSNLGTADAEPMGAYIAVPFSTGFQEGYQTMDALAGLVFGIVLAINIEALGIKEDERTKEATAASIGGGMLLLIIYSMIVFIGLNARMYIHNAANGADVLSASAYAVSGSYGRIILAIIFILACFNTSTSLLSSCGEYFHMLIPKLSRGMWIALFAIISGVISKVGLNAIISLSSPVLSLLYPAAIMLIALSLIPQKRELKWTYRISIALALISSLLTIIGIFPSPFLWLIPAIIGAMLGYAIDRKA